jgi:hypothetical protein
MRKMEVPTFRNLLEKIPEFRDLGKTEFSEIWIRIAINNIPAVYRVMVRYPQRPL